MTSDKEAMGGDFDQLRKDYGKLKSERDKLAGNLEQLEGDLAKLKETLKADYGSDDLKKLQALLTEKQADNDAKTAKYGEHLTKLQGQLRDLEREIEGNSDGVGAEGGDS